RDMREVALSPNGIEFDKLSPGQQQEIVKAVSDIGFSYKMLQGAHIRVEYVPSGRYVWHPRRALQKDGTSGARLPLIQGDNPDVVLAAARQADSEATASNIDRCKGILAVIITYGEGGAWSFGKPSFSWR